MSLYFTEKVLPRDKKLPMTNKIYHTQYNLNALAVYIGNRKQLAKGKMEYSNTITENYSETSVPVQTACQTRAFAKGNKYNTRDG